MARLIYDFETTGFFNKLGLDHPSQPHVVQVAAILSASSGETIASLDLIAQPAGWTIPAQAANVHGITTEIAEAQGIPEAILIACLWALWSKADVRIAHNEQFDDKIMRIALARFKMQDELEAWQQGKSFCTADQSTSILQIPPTTRMVQAGFGNEFKRPKLAEAYLKATGKEIVNAHSAMPDVLACKAVFDWLQELPEENSEQK